MKNFRVKILTGAAALEKSDDKVIWLRGKSPIKKMLLITNVLGLCVSEGCSLSKQIFFVLPLGRYLCQISLDWLAMLAYTSLPLHPKPKDCELSHFFNQRIKLHLVTVIILVSSDFVNERFMQKAAVIIIQIGIYLEVGCNVRDGLTGSMNKFQ